MGYAKLPVPWTLIALRLTTTVSRESVTLESRATRVLTMETVSLTIVVEDLFAQLAYLTLTAVGVSTA